MKGIAFLNADGILSFRTSEFLDFECPHFMTDNYHHISKAWRFNTDDFDSMHAMFSSMRDLRLKGADVLAFSKAIGFDLQRLKDKK
ncbi:MAG TPA: hypothetical protein VFM18_21120 [Methanosarcina sp.]|nr:hypothetical protein [Methanosarcina sp.]